MCHSWHKVPNAPILWRPLILPTLLFQILPTYPLPISSTPAALFVAFFLCPNVWSRHIWCATLLKYYGFTHVEPCYRSIKRNLLCVLCTRRRFTEVWQIMCFFTSILILCHTPTPPHTRTSTHTRTHTHTDPWHTQRLIDWHTQVNIC